MTYTSDRPLKVGVTKQDAAAVIELHGSVRMADCDLMRQAIDDLTAGRTSPIVLDMTDLDFICSAGLGAIISGHLKTRDYAGRICLVSPQAAVLKLLETTRLTEVFAIFATVEEALA